MKKIFIFLFLFVFAFSNNLNIVSSNSYYTKANLNEMYTKLLAYEETVTLIKTINDILNNPVLKDRIYFEEMGKVKISTLTFLEQLKYFLNGWRKYTNTYFDNNSNLAGIKKILKDSIDNDSNFLNTPQNIIKDMNKSIVNLGFFKKAESIKKESNPVKVLKDLTFLINSYYFTLSQIKSPLLMEFNSKIKDELEKNYRIYAKTSLIKTIKIFKNLLNQNYKSLSN